MPVVPVAHGTVYSLPGIERLVAELLVEVVEVLDLVEVELLDEVVVAELAHEVVRRHDQVERRAAPPAAAHPAGLLEPLPQLVVRGVRLVGGRDPGRLLEVPQACSARCSRSSSGTKALDVLGSVHAASTGAEAERDAEHRRRRAGRPRRLTSRSVRRRGGSHQSTGTRAWLATRMRHRPEHHAFELVEPAPPDHDEVRLLGLDRLEDRLDRVAAHDDRRGPGCPARSALRPPRSPAPWRPPRSSARACSTSRIPRRRTVIGGSNATSDRRSRRW